MIDNKNKRILIIFILVVLFSFLLFPNHYVTDTYNLIDLGFKEYALKWFAPSGRTIGMLVLFLFEKIGCSIDWFIFILKSIAVIFATISIEMFYNLLIKKAKIENDKIKKYGVFLATIIIFLNHGTHQFFFYPESAVMWLGILSVVIALKIFASDNIKFKYIKIFFWLLLAINSYQSVVLLYFPVTMLLVGLEGKDVKHFICESIKNGILIILTFVLGYITVLYLRASFDSIEFKSVDIVFNVDIILKNLNLLLITCKDGFPNIILTSIYLLMSIVVLIISKDKYEFGKAKTIFIFICTLLSTIFEILILVSIIDFYLVDRVQFAYIALMGIIGLYILLYTQLTKNNLSKNIIFTILCVVLVFNIWNSIDLSNESRKAIERDKEIFAMLKEKIDMYESKNGKITKAYFCYDMKPGGVDPTIRRTEVVTRTLVSTEWAIENAFKYYTGLDVEFESKGSIFRTIFDCKNWEEFSTEQLQFKDNEMYFLVY